jgi:hypothetical protein
LISSSETVLIFWFREFVEFRNPVGELFVLEIEEEWQAS